MKIQNANTKDMHILDTAILEDIWRSLWKEETIRAIDIQDISVVVENGQACLSGHVSKDNNDQRIEEITRSIPGVTAVHNHLIADHDLNIQVAHALANDERTRPFVIPVYSYHGWVELDGTVPNRDIQQAAEETASSVTAVRGVILPPSIKGENPFPVRDAIQPRIGVKVYGDDENVGTVYQVVVNPQNRLVTHMIVRVNRIPIGIQEASNYVVPVEAMRLVDACGIFLNHRAPAIYQFPVFAPVNYPFAPLTWQPPYPYAVGSVRWPRPEKVKTE